MDQIDLTGYLSTLERLRTTVSGPTEDLTPALELCEREIASLRNLKQTHSDNERVEPLFRNFLTLGHDLRNALTAATYASPRDAASPPGQHP